MSSSSIRGMVALIVLGISSAAFALPRELVQRGESATAAVQDSPRPGARTRGSAFCISKSGVFITTASVAGVGEGSELQLVFSPGQSNQRSMQAKVVRRDTDRNVAVLQASSPELFTPLEFGDDSQLYDTMDVAQFGYPERLPFVNGPGTPSINVAMAHITSLVKNAGRLEQIITDVPSYRGAVGGPVLDDKGRVIGLITLDQFGRSSKILPIETIQRLLLRPQISVRVKPFTYAQRHATQQVTFNVVSLLDSDPAYDAEFTIHAGHNPPRMLNGRLDNGSITFSFTPVPSKSGAELHLSATFTDGSMKGTIENRGIIVGDKSIDLSSVEEIHRDAHGSDSTVKLVDGKTLTGKLDGLNGIQLKMGPTSAVIDLGRATDISFTEESRPIRSIDYVFVVKLKGKTMGELVGEVELSGAPPKTESDSMSDMGPHIDIASGDLTTPGALVNTPTVGGPGGNPIELHSMLPRDVVGFSYEMGVWANRPILRRFEPLYDRGVGVSGQTIYAKDGYVVGGILVDSDLYTHAVRVIFMRLNNGRLNPRDNYLSPWIGRPISGFLPKQLAGHGERVVGVCGRKGINMDALGLIIRP